MKKRLLSIILALVMAISLVAPAFAFAPESEIPMDGGSEWPEDEEFILEPVGERERYIPYGEGVTLQVQVAKGDAEGVTYQWYTNDPGHMRDVLVAPIPGANEDTYVVDSVTSHVVYRCEAVDVHGNAWSVWFRLYVDNDLVVEPVGETERYVPYGESVTMEVSVSAADMEDLCYQWFYWLPGEGLCVLEGETDSDAYTVDCVEGHREYYCQVTDRFGSESGIYFNVYVADRLDAWPTTQQNFWINPGEGVYMAVAATAPDMESVHYQWYRQEGGDCTELEDMDLIPGADSDSWAEDGLTQNGTYCCRVTADGDIPEFVVWFYVYINSDLSAWAAGGEDSLTVERGGSAAMTVEVSASDMKNITCQWYELLKKDGEESREEVLIPGATDVSYTAENVTSYREFLCRVRDDYGNECSVVFHVRVENNLTAWPASGDNNITVELGGNVTMEVAFNADDMEGITCQWVRLDPCETPEGMDWEYVSIDGATDSVYEAENVTMYTRYVCRVSDPYGNMDEVWFYIHPENHLDVWSEGGEEVSVPYGESATLQVGVSADDMEGITYQWIRTEYNPEWNGYDWIDIEGATSETYTVENVTDARDYYCRVTDKYGNSTEAYFYVHVESDMSLVAVGDTEFHVEEGSDVTLEVQVVGVDAAEVNLQWYGPIWREDEHGGGYWDMGPIEGANTEQYTAENVTTSCEYYCMATDDYGTQATVWFYVYIGGGDQGYLDAWNLDGDAWVYVPYGQSATLAVGVSCEDISQAQFRWYLRTEDEDGDWVETEIAGAESDTYVTEAVTGRQEYVCRVQYGSLSVDVWFCTMVDNALDIWPEGDSVLRVARGDSVTLAVEYSAVDMDGLALQWFRGETPIPDATGRTFTVENVQSSERFTCTVTDRFGNSREAYFSVVIENHFSVSIVGERERYVLLNDGVTLEVEVHADDMEGVTYQWFRDDMPIEGATGSSYTVDDVNMETRGRYQCEAADRFGNRDLVGFVIRIDNGLTAGIVGQEDRTVPCGSDVTLEITASAYDMTDLDITWFRQWQEIDGVKGRTLTLENVTETCEYEVEVVDRFFNSVTLYFRVSIDNGLTVTPVGETDLTVPYDGSVTLTVEASADDTEGLTYRWSGIFRQNAAVGDGGELEGQNGPTATIDNITESMEYICTVTDKYGNQESTSFRVRVDNDFRVNGGGTVTVEPHGTVTLHVDASARDAEGMTFTWGTPEGWLSESSDTLVLTDVTESGEYFCYVFDRYHSWEQIFFYVEVVESMPLAITAQPEDFTGAVGEMAVFTVGAEGEGLAYQWQTRVKPTGSWNNSNASGNKTATLKIPVTAARDGYQYRCVVTDVNGEQVITDPATLHVASTLRIVSQPEDFTGAVGEMAIFTVAAEGEGLTYQWQTRVKPTGSWNNSNAVGSKTATMRITVTAARNGYQYRCVITDAYGEQVVSEPATLHVTAPLRIIAQPEDYVGAVGEMAIFTVDAEGEGLTYQWQTRVKPTGKWNSSNASGNKTDTLKIPVTAVRDGYQYRCVVTDVNGEQVISDPATLYVAAPLRIVSQPEDYTGAVGEMAIFTVAAEGEGLAYQWQTRVKPTGSWNNSNASGNKTDTLKITVTAARDGYAYRCVITDAYGNTVTTEPATLHVAAPLRIVSQPEDFTGAVGETAIFTVGAEGEGLAYQWQTRVKPTGSWNNSNASGNKTDTLKITVTAARDGYAYRCIITDVNGEQVISEPATLHVTPPLRIISQPEDYTGAVGETAIFTVGAEGEGLAYQWQIRVKPAGSWNNSNSTGNKTATLKIPVTAARDGYAYRCVISDDAGNTLTTEPATLHVIVPEPEGVAIDETNFPDADFRSLVAALYDSDGNGVLSDEEIAAVREITCSEILLTSLRGVEYFTELEKLDCARNDLTELDVSANTKLVELRCGDNRLAALNVSANTELTLLTCSGNRFTELDLSNNTKLSYFACSSSQLTELDISHCPHLIDVYTNGTRTESNTWVVYTLDDLYMRVDASLQIITGQETEGVAIDETNFPDATFRAYVAGSCDADGNGYLSDEEIVAVTEMTCRNSDIASLRGVAYFTALQKLYCSGNQLTELDISANTGLIDLYCVDNQLTELDISRCPQLVETYRNGERSEDGGMIFIHWNDCALSYDGDVTIITGQETEGVAIDETNFPDDNFRACVAENCDADGNGYLSDEEIAAVKDLIVSDKDISSLQGVEYFTALTDLSCFDNQLTSLDVSANTALTYLHCGGNQLTSLDVSANTALEYLYCGANELTSLDVSANTALTHFNFYANHVTSIDVSANTALTELDCHNNHLTTLDISACPYLVDAYLNGASSEDAGCVYYYLSYPNRYELMVDSNVTIIAS